jgi:genome maintenance exonuclease 1
MAHNYVYRTNIQQGVVLMCSKDGLFQKFETFDKEFVGYQHAFLRKIDQYYKLYPNQEPQKDTKNEQKPQ